MTNSDALKSVTKYPLSANAVTRICADRGITAAGTYAGKDQAFELAMADVYAFLAASGNISEGGFSISISDREQLANMADAIYSKWGDGMSAAGMPTVRNKSNLW
ncbi:MAG: hypothetical protein M0Q91_11955 [Methanoregula sp.]|jgi:hypothetical protein|nr:hypothetical protein [Methanoregula sp.]